MVKEVATYLMITFVLNSQNTQIFRDKKYTKGCLRLGCGADYGVTANGNRTENVLTFIV